jgi:hypothetical protein
VGGLTLDELVERTRFSGYTGFRALKVALAEEVDRGRVLIDDGVYRLRPGALEPGVAEALRGLARPDAATLANGHVGGRRPDGGALSSHEQTNLRVA